MIWMLLIVALNPGGGVAIETIPYDDQLACQNAALVINTTHTEASVQGICLLYAPAD